MSKPQQGSPRPHARPAPPPRRARSGRASPRSVPAANPARPPTPAVACRPSASPPHSPSHAGAATTAPRSTHLRQTATRPPGTSPQPQPEPQPGPEDPMNRVLPSMLAPSPSQHLESDFKPFGNPKSDSALPKRALAVGRTPSASALRENSI